MKSILLLEPSYRNKYPPIGLMKLATYHKMQGDDVTFYKGNASDVAINESVKDILNYFTDSNVILSKAKLLIKDYIITGKNSILEILLNYVSDDEEKTFKLMKKLNMYRSAKTSGRMHELFFWDRIYVTTLFTFYWNASVK